MGQLTASGRAGAWRRTALSCLLAGALLLSPAMARAAFTGGSAGALPVGSATLSPPASATATVSCPHGNGNGNGNGNLGSATVTFPNAPAASGYRVVLTAPTGDSTAKLTGSGSLGASFSPITAGTYLVTVSSMLQNWTSATTTTSFTC